MFENCILHIIRKLNKHEMPCNRSIIHKIMYLTFYCSEHLILFTPYLYGPYCDDIQLMIQHLIDRDIVQHDKLFNIYVNPDYKYSTDEYTNTIDIIIDFLIKEKLNTIKDVSDFAKVFMIKEYMKDKNCKDIAVIKIIKDNAGFVRWNELAEEKDIYLLEKVKQANKLLLLLEGAKK